MHLRRAIVLDGESDTYSYPDWYVLLRAADRLHTTVRDLVEWPAWWIDKALIAMTAETQAQEIIDKRNQ